MGRIVAAAELGVALEDARAKGRRIVLTNGCFDLLHVGHVRSLRAAKQLGDVLVVGINSDDSVRKLKGAARPLLPEAERAEVIAALESVDYVVIFGEATAERLVEHVRPEVYVKGGDYQLTGAIEGAGAVDRVDMARLPEAKVVASYGGRTVLVSLVDGRSTSEIVRRIRAGAEPG